MPSGDFRPPSTDWQQGYDAGYREAYRRTCGDAAIEREARHQALTDAIAAVDDVRFQFAAFPGDGADGDGPLGQLMAAVIDTLTRLLRGET